MKRFAAIAAAVIAGAISPGMANAQDTAVTRLEPVVVEVSRGAGKSLLIWGRIGPSGVVLEPAFEVDVPVSQPQQKGRYSVDVVDGSGRVTSNVSFAGIEVDLVLRRAFIADDLHRFGHVERGPQNPIGNQLRNQV